MAMAVMVYRKDKTVDAEKSRVLGSDAVYLLYEVASQVYLV